MQLQLHEANEKVLLLQKKEHEFQKKERKYLEKLNRQNENLRMIKLIYEKTSSKMKELQDVNSKLYEKLGYYIQTGKISQEDAQQFLQRNNLENQEILDDIQNYIDVKDGEIRATDFYHQSDEDDDDEELELNLKENNLSSMYYQLMDDKKGKAIHRPHLIVKSHSCEDDVRINQGKPKSTF